ncbi:GNAT family N-acetyltransferase [Limimaricola hongkongensis]|uniref:Ribosomal-protein-S18p-alanine acetyltransferase n=1 Tax=Limimaricola hongkongensis DSM 17492 TaxID=1122180 RepID=A0A017H857_9RHOB|nr:GNAT family N-acetyltransferase [Limimaricola hongkongensis]EYD70682.1 Ribosomal-protein-S18p-alanine acetyltransferase [Limimaricola hongkongensis DSM 17492]
MSDAAALAATHAAAFVDERGWSTAEMAALLAASGTILTGDATSFVLGRVTLDEAEILTLATHPDHRRQGRAGIALDAFHAAAAAAGAQTAFLEVAEDNAAARALYAARGYTQAGRRQSYYPRADAPPAAALILTRALR